MVPSNPLFNPFEDNSVNRRMRCPQRNLHHVIAHTMILNYAANKMGKQTNIQRPVQKTQPRSRPPLRLRPTMIPESLSCELHTYMSCKDAQTMLQCAVTSISGGWDHCHAVDTPIVAGVGAVVDFLTAFRLSVTAGASFCTGTSNALRNPPKAPVG